MNKRYCTVKSKIHTYLGLLMSCPGQTVKKSITKNLKTLTDS